MLLLWCFLLCLSHPLLLLLLLLLQQQPGLSKIVDVPARRRAGSGMGGVSCGGGGRGASADGGGAGGNGCRSGYARGSGRGGLLRSTRILGVF